MLKDMKSALRETFNSSLLGARLLLAYHQFRGAVLSRMSDEEFAQRSHRKATGIPLDLENPRTFDERLWWLKLYYRDPLMIQCSDKIEARRYVEEKGLAHLLTPLLGVYEHPREIEWESLPQSFYIKTNHSSGTNIRCDDLGAFDRRHAEKLLGVYLKRNHYWLSREWNYRDIQPRVMIEPVLETTDDEGLIDYRFLCSYGQCHGIMYDVGTADENGRHRDNTVGNLYDKRWNLLPVSVNQPRIMDREIDPPAALAEMVRYAEMLSSPFPFCRVDFYNPKGKDVVFGEITFFNRGGNNVMDPPEYQLVMGGWVALG